MADAAAGADYIKIRADAMFSDRDVRALAVHEAWCTWAPPSMGRTGTFLSKGPPSSTVTQERPGDLIITFASYPSRLRKLPTTPFVWWSRLRTSCRCSSSSVSRGL